MIVRAETGIGKEAAMSILFVLLMFLLILSITYFVKRPGETTQPAMIAAPPAPEIEREVGFDVPKGYCFHPGHTWVLDEGRQNARIGLDAFATNLLGKIDRIEVIGLNRWVRQGQKLMTVTHGGMTADLVSPVEGIVISVNPQILRDPDLLVKDPYQDGWVCVVKSPDLATNVRNLVQGTMVAPWMQHTLGRLTNLTSQYVTATAADGGLPILGLLGQLEPGLQQRLIHEFFLT
jgi:glycine cleavage system H lipoate-binding protein